MVFSLHVEAITMSMPTSTPLLSASQACDMINGADTFIFDCDGVLWTGPDLIDGADMVLSLLRQLGKRIFFVSNNSTKSRHTYVTKFAKLGIDADATEVYGSARIAADYIKHTLKLSKRIYVVGDTGIMEELRHVGIDCIGGPEMDTVCDWTGLDNVTISLDSDVEAVLLGFDIRINYRKIAMAHKYLGKPQVHFLATNRDVTFPSPTGILPGTGPTVAALEASTHRKCTVLGKPSPFVFDCISREHGKLDPSRTVVVGDRLDTDIELGFDNSMITLLTLSGVTHQADIDALNSIQDPTVRPSYYVNALSDLLDVLKSMVN